MTRDLRADLDPLSDRHRPPATGEPASGRWPGPDGDIGVLGQAISDRLFSAALDLDFALSLDGDGPTADRLRHAVAELDDAVKELRHLMLAVPGPAAGAAPAAFPGDDGSGPRRPASSPR